MPAMFTRFVPFVGMLALGAAFTLAPIKTAWAGGCSPAGVACTMPSGESGTCVNVGGETLSCRPKPPESAPEMPEILIPLFLLAAGGGIFFLRRALLKARAKS